MLPLYCTYPTVHLVDPAYDTHVYPLFVPNTNSLFRTREGTETENG